MATVVVGDFEWNDHKANANLKKHGVSFEEAITALADRRANSAPLVALGSSVPGRPRPLSGGNMRKRDVRALPEGHIDRYDWSRAVRGRHAAKAARATALLRMLDPELAARFPDSGAVNAALRALLAVQAALPKGRPRRRAA